MELDNTTYNDLSIYQHEEESSIFHRLNFTRTSQGREWLLKFFGNPFSDIKPIQDTQKIVRSILDRIDEWPTDITNGTLMVIEKFYDSSIDAIPDANIVNAFIYKVFHSPDFSLVRYSISHFGDFIRGMHRLVQLLDHNEAPLLIRTFLRRAADLLDKPVLSQLAQHPKGANYSW